VWSSLVELFSSARKRWVTWHNLVVQTAFNIMDLGDSYLLFCDLILLTKAAGIGKMFEIF